MVDDDFVSVGRPLPRILTARLVEGLTVEVTWQSGVVQKIDVTPAIIGHRHFLHLRDNPEGFARFSVSETGDSLLWESGEELSAVWLEELAPASLENAEFREAMTQLRLNLDGMAARLGIARRLVADYRKDRPIPKTVALATRYLLDQQRAG